MRRPPVSGRERNIAVEPFADRARTPRLLVADLAAEEAWAAEERGGRRPALDAALERRIAFAGTAMRALAEPGDRLWTPMELPRGVLAELPGALGAVVPRLVSGPLERATGGLDPLPWAETAAVARLRRPGEGLREPAPPGAPLHALLRSLPTPPAEIARWANRRSTALEMARELDVALPGARLVSSPDELEAHLARGAAGADATTAGWVVKAPFAAAGRHRLIVEPGAAAPPPARLERLFARWGELLFEPWLERVVDFGTLAVVTAEETRVVGHHRLRVDRYGRFLAVRLTAGTVDRDSTATDDDAGPAPVDAERLGEISVGVGERLRRAGYRGPLSIDSFRYRRENGTTALHPLCEINARLSFGFLARCFAERLAGDLGPEEGTVAELSLNHPIGRRTVGPKLLRFPLSRSSEPGAPELRLTV